MLYFLCEWLKNMGYFKVPHVFFYTSTRMALAAITSLVIAIFLGPYFILFLQKWNIKQMIREKECQKLYDLHESKKKTPTMGGILILTAILIPAILYMDFSSIFSWILLFSAITFGALGFADDYLKLKYKNSKGLKGRTKLFVQVICSSMVVFTLFSGVLEPHAPVIKEYQRGYKENVISLKEYVSRIYVPFVKTPLKLSSFFASIFLFIFIIMVITGASNAVNLTDGLDGLAAGSVFMAALCLACIGFMSNHAEIAQYLNILYVEGAGEITIFLSALSGACLGFLWYNSYPAQVFMGDTGSLALGGLIGVSAVLLKRELLLAIIGGIFVAEAASVLLQVLSYKLRNKKRIFLCAPLHHHFEYAGLPETKIVVRFWIVGFLLSLIGMISLKFQ
jgi:phospho-N-acetylmuramoyl-pentapeptide-transferase